jgi:hypothetical protein
VALVPYGLGKSFGFARHNVGVLLFWVREQIGSYLLV